MKKRFVVVDPQFLEEIFAGNVHTPTLYYHPNLLVRHYFWERLRKIAAFIGRRENRGGDCLDFGGGSGVLLPTLSTLFSRVRCLDLDPQCAQLVKQRYTLDNVEIDQEDAFKITYRPASFDTIVAADVLEHFEDLPGVITLLKAWLADNGVLYTSLPSENALYSGLRKAFGITKPTDHFHTADDVERLLAAGGFRRVHAAGVPTRIGMFRLFSICAWQKNPAV